MGKAKARKIDAHTNLGSYCMELMFFRRGFFSGTTMVAFTRGGIDTVSRPTGPSTLYTPSYVIVTYNSRSAAGSYSTRHDLYCLPTLVIRETS